MHQEVGLPLNPKDMSVSINRGPFSGCLYVMRALIFGVDIRAPEFWNSHLQAPKS